MMEKAPLGKVVRFIPRGDSLELRDKTGALRVAYVAKA